MTEDGPRKNPFVDLDRVVAIIEINIYDSYLAHCLIFKTN